MDKPAENILEYNYHAKVLLSQLIEKNKCSYPLEIIFDSPTWIKPGNISKKLDFTDSAEYHFQKSLISTFKSTEFCREYLEKNGKRPFAYHFYSYPVFSKNFELAYVEHFKRFAPLVGHGQNIIFRRESHGTWIEHKVIGDIIS